MEGIGGKMITADYPVKIYCPLSSTEELVYFHPVEMEGKWYVSIDSFNGCDRLWHACKECEVCKIKAYEMMFGTEK